MPLPFRLHPEADAEGIEAARYIEADDPLEGARFRQTLTAAVGWACRDPLIFRCFEDDFRKVRVGKFRYALIFRLRGDEIQILAVAHLSRRPGYWKSRSRDWP